MITIVSWDIGIRTLSFSVIEMNSDTKSFKIKGWKSLDILDGKYNVSNVSKVSDKILISCLISSINKYRNLIANHSIKRVVIENQSSKFTRMKSIQTALITFYIMNGFTSSQIITQFAMKKFDVIGGTESITSKYRGKKNRHRRKSLALDVCKRILTHEKKEKALSFIEKKGSHDLADCLLTGLSYLQYKLKE